MSVTTVYIVETGAYENHGVVGVYSDLQAALNSLTDLFRRDEAEITEWSVNGESGRYAWWQNQRREWTGGDLSAELNALEVSR